ncbi:transcriptional regulator [Labilibaculum sp. A4]|uniref:PLDc N-terminal domain-containing protein n=1 Tax=Labilibaculum euxinus TaxID=2686357 RepID=UPI000F61BB53|nr:PLDc N-terminal domain-containing protein [Labilibaculum euxinus]MDQ1772507.1 PLDc N-terminal domain-containing protein [Labilibaculum euxinus]MWN78208.1 transcriptional regulator [Labilibaculum euxinus]
MILSIIFDIWLLTKLIGILLPVVAVVDIFLRDLLGINKLFWVLLVVFIPFLGSIIYFYDRFTYKAKI